MTHLEEESVPASAPNSQSNFFSCVGTRPSRPSRFSTGPFCFRRSPSPMLEHQGAAIMRSLSCSDSTVDLVATATTSCVDGRGMLFCIVCRDSNSSADAPGLAADPAAR